MTETFEAALEALARGEAINANQQVALSDLGPRQAPAFLAAWGRLNEPARLKILSVLADLARANLRLDFNALCRLALRDPAPAVRAAAVRASQEDESDQFLHALLDVLERDPSLGVREAAAEALAPFAYRAEIGQLDEQEASGIQAALLARAQDEREDPGIRAAALAGLGYFSEPQAQAAVMTALSNPALELAAVRGLGRSANQAYVERLVEYSRRPEPELRQEAATALGEIEDQEAVPRLVELIEDPDQRVQQAALRALGQVGGVEAREALVYVAESSDPAVAQVAQEALKKMESFEQPLGF